MRSLKKVVLFTRSLNTGGAERQLCELAKYLALHDVDVTVITYYSGGKFEQEIAQFSEIKLISLGSKGAFYSAFLAIKVPLYCLRSKIDLLYCFIGSEPAYLTSLICKTKTIISIRGGVIDFKINSWKTKYLLKLGVYFSRKVNLIIANSSAGMEFYASLGYPKEKMIKMFNGIDIDRFTNSNITRQRMRDTLNISSTKFVIGYFARFHPEKGHQHLIEALSKLVIQKESWILLLAGGGNQEYKQSLKDLSCKLGLESQIVWLNDGLDMPSLYSVLDLAVMPSSPSEGFPNFLGEAMAMSLPCISTDVSESSTILGNSDYLVSYGDIHSLAERIEYFFNLSGDRRAIIGSENRKRIETMFSVKVYGNKCMSALEELVGK